MIDCHTGFFEIQTDSIKGSENELSIPVAIRFRPLSTFYRDFQALGVPLCSAKSTRGAKAIRSLG
ncbi:MAG: hypothetical protein M3Q32_11900, partial [Pseudomonadota bacterium]|nr:hypothetical protein [Pseudomonadota bacterium]